MSQIRVTVKFFTSLRAITGEREKTLFLPEDSNMDYLLKDLINQYPELAKKIDYAFIGIQKKRTPKKKQEKERKKKKFFFFFFF